MNLASVRGSSWIGSMHHPSHKFYSENVRNVCIYVYMKKIWDEMVMKKDNSNPRRFWLLITCCFKTKFSYINLILTIKKEKEINKEF